MLSTFKTLALVLLTLLAFADAEEGHLLVADPAVSKLYVYSLPELEPSGELGVRVGSHAGFLPLGDGRVLFVDEDAAELVALRLGADGAEVVGRAAVGVPASHITVDPESVSVGEGGLESQQVFGYDVSGRSGGRAYFVRMSDAFLYTYLRVMASAETPWQDWENDLYLLDLTTDEATRMPLAPGLVFRFALSEPYALLFNVHPDGDHAYLLDVDPASASFHELVVEIALEPLSNAPQPDASPWTAETRRAAITPDGRWGFVSHGGDGLVSVIDLGAREVVRLLEVPSALSDGGYLLAVQPGTAMHDTVGR